MSGALESRRRKDGAFGQAKVRRQIGGAWMIEDGRMAGWILSILVDPRIQARVVVIKDFFVVDCAVV